MGTAPGYTFTSGPIVANGTIVTGLTGCGRFREDTCYVVGLDGSNRSDNSFGAIDIFWTNRTNLSTTP